MASLEDFAPNTGASLDDFTIKGPLMPIGNDASNTNLAAFTAALSEEPKSVEATYLRIADQLNQRGENELAQSLLNKAKAETGRRNQDAFVNILSDPSLSDEQKQAVVSAHMDERSSLYDIQNLVSTESLIAESDPDETEESSTARVNFGEVLEEANEFRNWKQSRLTLELDQNNQGFISNAADFIEIVMPFAEGSVSGRTVSRMREGDAGAIAEGFAWMGGSKAEIRETLKGLPIPERRKAMEKVIQAVNSSSSIVLPGDNEFAREEMLRTALETNYYGEGEEWLDNAISVLDMLGLTLGAKGLAVKGIRRATRAITKAKRASVLETPAPSAYQAAKDRPYVETATDDELMAAEDAAEAASADRRLRAEEDASERAVAARREEQEADPVRRAERGAEAREESRRAVRGEGRDALSEMEAASESRIAARRTGGDAARMTDEELRMTEDAAEAMASRVRRESVKSKVQPASLSQNYRNTNPAKARALNAAVSSDESGQVAKATYGATRQDAIAHDHLPEIKQVGGEVKNKVHMPDPVRTGPRRLPNSLKDLIDSSGALQFSEAIKTTVASKVVSDFNNAVGVVARTEMTVPEVQDIGGVFKVGVTYGPRDNGWLNPQDALDKVRTSLRAYGVREDDLTLMARQGDNYVPVDKSDVGSGSDFLVKVDYDFPISAKDVQDLNAWEDIDVKFNWLDRIPHIMGGIQGTLTRTFLDPASLFNKHMLAGATTGVLKSAAVEKLLGDMTSEFSTTFQKLSKPMKAVFDDEIKRANLQGWNKSHMSLRAEGWDEVAIEALDHWREAWDAIYWLENGFLAKDLRNKGYGILEDATQDTRLFVREFKRGGAGNAKRVYNPDTGKMENLTKEQIDELYEGGGSIGKLRSKFMAGDEEVAEFVKVRNTPDSFVRRIRDDDQILNYREGYYTVHYDAPKFVDRVVMGRDNRELMRSTVAAAQDISSATRMIDGLKNGNVPDNVKFVRRDATERQSYGSDDTWSMQESSGRVAQRVRGERLADASSAITDESMNHILSPADSLIRAVRGVSPKAGMGDVLETMKQNAIAKFGHMFPTNEIGQPVFPKNTRPENIRAGEAYGKEAADARSAVEFINSLERPYFNFIDDGIKLAFRAMADMAGSKNFSYAERLLNGMGEVAQPTRLGKGTAFTLYLALNPQRQLLVQSFQATQLLALDPLYAAGQLGPDMGAMLSRRLEGHYSGIDKWKGGSSKSKKELDEIYDAMDKSGITAVIDKSNLIRGTMQEVADATSMGGRRSVAGQVTGRASQGVAAARKVGFDAGETVNKVSSWLTHYNIKRKEVGRKLTKSDLDDVTWRAENWTYNMTRAGEMAYNENALGMLTQFMQVPHKAFLTMSTNRHLSWKQKARLVAFNTALFGAAPGTFLYELWGSRLPTDEEGVGAETREAIMQGLGGYLFNKMVGSSYGFISGEKNYQDIDFQSLRSTDGQGLWEFVTDLLTTDVGEMVANTPAGSLLMGYNPRVANAIKKVAEFAHFKEPDDENRADLGEVMISLGNLSSGFSNAYKAGQILYYEKKYNSEGGSKVDNAPTPTAVAQAWGLNTVEEARGFYVSQRMYEESQDLINDVKERHRLYNQDLYREGITQDETEFVLRKQNATNRMFQSQRGRELWLQEISRDIGNGKDTLLRNAARSIEWMEEDNARSMINALPVSEERKAGLHELVDDIKNIGNEEQ